MDTSFAGLQTRGVASPSSGPDLRDEPVVDDARLLLELSRDVTSTLDLQVVLDRSFKALRALIDFGGGAIQLIEDGFLVAVATDPPISEEARGVRIPVGQGISGAIAATGEPIYIPDIWADPRVHPDGKRRGVSTGVRSYLGVPLIMHGEPVGVLQIDSPRFDAFPPGSQARLLAFTPTIAAAVQNAQMFQREAVTIERLRETERIKRDFLAVVSHELRTPLTSVAGFGYTLAERAPDLDAETVADIGRRVWRAGRRLERVMADLLDLSQIERGTFHAHAIPTELEPILTGALREQTTDDHVMDLALEPGLPRVLANPPRLHQAIGNLLSNARKFSPPGSRVEVRAWREVDRVVTSVSDEGRGIEPQMLDRIFEPFFQSEPAATRSADGLGVGLYLVKQFCGQMDATVSVESEPGKGARFEIHLRVT